LKEVDTKFNMLHGSKTFRIATLTFGLLSLLGPQIKFVFEKGSDLHSLDSGRVRA